MKEKFEAISPAEFFKRNRYIAGFQNPVRAVYQTVKELVENSLDATEPHGILPDVKLFIEYEGGNTSIVKITCSDNGIGIPGREVPNAFGRVLYGSKYVERQTRGVFGLGVKMAVLYAQMTTGRPVEVITKPLNDDKTYYFKIEIDTKNNEPVVLEEEVKNSKNDLDHGTTIVLSIEGDWGRARNYVLDYIKRTHVLCPYTSFLVRYPEDGMRTLVLRRASEKLPPPPKTINTHPHGVDVDTFRAMVMKEKSGVTLIKFLSRRFSGVGEKSAKAFVEAVGISPRRSVKGLSKEEVVKIVQAMKQFEWKPPPPHALSPVGEENIVVGLKEVFSPEFVTAVTRAPKAYSGHPFVVEAGLAYGGKIEPSQEPVLLRYANKIPLIYDEGVDVSTAVVREINWGDYKVFFPAQLVILTHIASTKIPYHTLGKEAVADVPEVKHELKLAVQECGRRLRTYLTSKMSREAKARKIVAISKYFPTISQAISSVTGDPQEVIHEALNKLLSSRLEEIEDER